MDRDNAQARREAELIEEQRIADLRAVLSRPEGKRFVWWLLERANFFKVDFYGNSRDAFRAGERNIGSMVFNAVLEVDPKLMGWMSQSHAAKIKEFRDKLKEKQNG